MSKITAMICAILLGIVLLGIYVVLMFFEASGKISLNIFYGLITGHVIGKITISVYEWLREK